MLPWETIEAAFPSSARAGKAKIGPMTLLHAVALEAFGVEVRLSYSEGDGNPVIAAWVLSLDASALREAMDGRDNTDALARFIERSGATEAEMAKAVREVFAAAFMTRVPPKDDGRIRFDDLGEGYGWPLEIAEAIASEHGVCIASAFETPVSTAFALLGAMARRNGIELGGPDYYDRIREAHFKEIARLHRAERNAKMEG